MDYITYANANKKAFEEYKKSPHSQNIPTKKISKHKYNRNLKEEREKVEKDIKIIKKITNGEARHIRELHEIGCEYSVIMRLTGRSSNGVRTAIKRHAALLLK